MRAVIEGKLYDTEAAEEICDVSANHEGRSDFLYDSTRLYRTAKGSFFIAGKGGPKSRWARPAGNGMGGGSGIRPVSEAEARKMVEEHASAETYARVFGEPEAAGGCPRPPVALRRSGPSGDDTTSPDRRK